jgi:hypothetical protein
MAINLSEVGASAAVNAAGVLEIKFGLYLPGIRSRDGFGVVVRVIHDADRFDPGVQPVRCPDDLDARKCARSMDRDRDTQPDRQ